MDPDLADPDFEDPVLRDPVFGDPGFAVPEARRWATSRDTARFPA